MSNFLEIAQKKLMRYNDNAAQKLSVIGRQAMIYALLSIAEDVREIRKEVCE